MIKAQRVGYVVFYLSIRLNLNFSWTGKVDGRVCSHHPKSLNPEQNITSDDMQSHRKISTCFLVKEIFKADKI
jgi:hypothetical protein